MFTSPGEHSLVLHFEYVLSRCERFLLPAPLRVSLHKNITVDHSVFFIHIHKMPGSLVDEDVFC